VLLEGLDEVEGALDSRGHRAIGVVYHPEREAYGNYVPTVLPYRYDAMLYIDRSHALSPLHMEPTPEHEVPETFPSGMWYDFVTMRVNSPPRRYNGMQSAFADTKSGIATRRSPSRRSDARGSCNDHGNVRLRSSTRRLTSGHLMPTVLIGSGSVSASAK
jgi:hypothetical protein